VTKVVGVRVPPPAPRRNRAHFDPVAPDSRISSIADQ
jgi:hypothetical protein